MVVQADIVDDDNKPPAQNNEVVEPPGSPIDWPTGNTSPAVLMLDDIAPSYDPPVQPPASANQIDSPFRIQGAIEVGQPVDHGTWDYYSTTDNLEECGVDDDSVYVPGRGFRRYYPALRQLTPFRFGTVERKMLPVDSVGLLSFATFSWMTGFMWKLYRRGSFAFDSYRCSFMESCNINSQRFEYLWGEELRSRGPTEASIFRTSFRFIRTRVALATLLYTINLLSGLLTPMFFLPVLVNNATNAEPAYLEGSFYVFAILVVDATRGLIMSLHGAITARTALRLRSAIFTLVYRKVLSLNSLGRTNSGQILNLFSNDSQRLLDFGQVLHMWVAGLLTVLISFVWLVSVLQVAGATGVGAFLVFFFLQYWLAKMSSKYKAQAVTVTDGRVQRTKEVLSAIKVIKVNAWEDAFFKIISNLRFNELRLLQKIVFMQFITGAFSNCIPAIVTAITFMTCLALGQTLTAAQSFAVFGVVGWSRYGLVFLPVSLGAIAQVRVTMTRVKELLLQEDIRPCISTPRDPNHAVCLTNATFGCDVLSKDDDDDGAKKTAQRTTTAKSSDGLKKKSGFLRPRKTLATSELNAKEETGETESLAAEANADSPAPLIVDVLHTVNLAVSKGQLVGICGPVGSGKSSLLMAILGQLHLRRGDLAFRGNFAYLSQQPWLMNATLRQNIVFADTFDSKRYYGTIHCCCLNEDLEALTGGDQTEIGESGSTLSGGQKQRVALARAVYANRDICLLDDPFSSLDGNVSEHVFQNCIRGALRTKTVLLVSQKPKFLLQCDHVVALRSGVIVEQGTPKELLAKNGYFTSLIGKFESEFGDATDDGQEFRRNGLPSAVNIHNGSKNYDIKSVAVAGRLTRAEDKGSGRVSWETYAKYVSALGGAGVAFSVMLSIVMFAAVVILSGWWMGAVIRSRTQVISEPLSTLPSITTTMMTMTTTAMPNGSVVENPTDVDLSETEPLPSAEPYLNSISTTMDDTTIQSVFAIVLIAIMLTCVLQAFLFSKATMAASRRLHDNVLDKVFHGTMRFFEVTPIGRIINVFSKDLDEVDCILPTMLNICCIMTWGCIFSLLSVAIIFPYFLLSVPLLGLVFAYTVLLFAATAREVKRREIASRSPLFGHVNATLGGLASLHAYDKERLFEREFVRLHDDNTTLTFLLIGSIRWMGVRLDMLVAISSSLVAAFIVFLHGAVAPSFAAMALIYCSTLSGLFNYTVRIISETQARFTHVERIIRYEQTLEWEGAKRNSLPPAPHDWPSKGEINFQNVDLKYREGLPLSLSGVSFRVPGGKKVAIVGRTGSGKSSLGVTLFRLVEVQCGTVAIDDVDIARLPLADLRSRMSIIPQDPVLFKGSVRYNLDPLNEHTDENIWQALAKIHLHEKIAGMENQLSCQVAESGDNFSVGEKQLLCLARALLRRSKIIFLDEALASVDTSNHALLHQAIFESCVNCTVLSVAHRLGHVMSYDYVLVMNDAKVVEFGTPGELASNATSWFSNLVAAELQQGDAGIPLDE